MVQLLLSEPNWSNDGDGDAVRQRISLLKKLESIIWSFIMSGSRSETRLWLCNTISCISSLTPHHQREVFLKLLTSRPQKRAIAALMLQAIFEKRPHKVGPIIAKKSYMLEKFFKGNPHYILKWFGNFASSGEHGKGARALSQFSFVNRDICWEELEWKGKHGQSPAMVATKPHYFLDLDVVQTVENFLENVPEFWSSNEFAESLKDGEVLLIDTKFFIDYFVDLMYEEDSKEVWELMYKFLKEEPFSLLCHHVLIILEEPDLRAFLDTIREFITPNTESKDFSAPSDWLEIVLSMCNGCVSIDELLLLNSVINQGRQLLRLLHDEDEEETDSKINDLVSQMGESSSITQHWVPFMKECFKTKKLEVIKWLGLQSFVFHYKISEECKTSELWESLFLKNDITFHKSDKYSLLRPDDISEGSGSDLEIVGSIKSRRKKKAKSRKRKKKMKYGREDSTDDELVDLNMSTRWPGLQSKAGNWLLSIDGFSSSWNSVDLPEHMAKHCFSTWMKWIFSN